MSHKIIVLVAPPRSLSTAFLKMMSSRGDFSVLNEPAVAVFNQRHYPYSQSFYSERALTSYGDIHQKIQDMALRSPVFIKEMSFAFEQWIIEIPQFVQNPNVFFVFLLRNPHAGLISYYKKVGPAIWDYVSEQAIEVTGYAPLYRVFKRLQREAVHQPHCIDADQLHHSSQQIVSAFCKYTDITYDDAFLHWSGSNALSLAIEGWQENKKPEFIYHWHQEAMVSEQFYLPTRYHCDESGEPTFIEIENSQHRKKCIEVYYKNRVFYELLKSDKVEAYCE